jgi:hypothetical protein
VIFRAREITHTTIGRDILEKVAMELADAASIEQAPMMDGKSLVMLLTPGAMKGGPEAAAALIRGTKVVVPPPEELTVPQR